MISQEISRHLYDSLMEVHSRNIKEFVENPILTKEDVPISKIIGMMLKEDVHEVFIQLPGKSISCINIRDILSSTHIETLKSSTVGRLIPTLTEKDNLGNAARLMNLQRLKSLPVVIDQDENQDQEIIGRISSKRIMQYIYDTISKKKTNLQSKITAADIMTPTLITINPSDKFDTAKGIMKKESIDQLPVVENRSDGGVEIKGMITSTHILQTLIPAESIGRRSLGSDYELKSNQEVMGLADKNVVTVKPNDTITTTINTLLKTNSTYAMVQSSDGLLGIITYRDIISLLGEQTQRELPLYIIGMPDDPFDSELIKSKFYNVVEFLSKITPKIEEARCRIKAIESEGSQKKRYEVTANIFTANKRYIYTSKKNWDLVSIFDDIKEGLRNQIGSEKDDKQKASIRYPQE